MILAGIAQAADLWLTPPREALPESSSWEASLRGGYAGGLVPPFRVADRDRIAVGLDADVQLGRVGLAISGEWLRDTTAAGEPQSGFGDLRLGSTVEVFRAGPVAFGLGWEAKLPNAADEGELGTDETDILFGPNVAGHFGPVRVVAAGGLAVLGNPLRFANQDDVPMLRLAADAGFGDLHASILGRWDVQTNRNPHRAELELALRYGPSWFVEAAGSAGLVPASADLGGRVAFGWRGRLPERPPWAPAAP